MDSWRRPRTGRTGRYRFPARSSLGGATEDFGDSLLELYPRGEAT
jgi:hypothetical protein